MNVSWVCGCHNSNDLTFDFFRLNKTECFEPDVRVYFHTVIFAIIIISTNALALQTTHSISVEVEFQIGQNTPFIRIPTQF